MTDSPRDLALLFKKIEGNRQALTSVWETTIATPAYFLLSNFKCWKKSKNKRTSLSRIWQHSSHLVPTCEISFYDCCEFFLDFIHSSCSKMALNVFQQMLFLRGVNFYDPFSFLKAVDKRFPIQKLPPCSTQ